MQELELPFWNCGSMSIDATRGDLERITFATRTYDPGQKSGGAYAALFTLCFSGDGLEAERYWYVTVTGDALGDEIPVPGVACK